jgi:excinuclease ABC subunit C
MFTSQALKHHLRLKTSEGDHPFPPYRTRQYKLSLDQVEHLPSTTGVYFLIDQRDRILYTGKSVNIRQRIRRHLNESNSEHHSRHLRLIANTAAVSWIETDSELIALLLEDELIKTLQPPFNVRQNEFRQYVYLAFSNEPFPRLLQLDAKQQKEYQSYGPFKDSWRSAEFIDMIHNWFPLRRCTTPTPRLRCGYYDIQSCCGPCRKAITVQDYQKTVNEVRAVLEVKHPQWVKKLDKAVQEASQKRQYEKAAKTDAQRQLYRRYARRTRFIENFKSKDLRIRENGCSCKEFLFRKGVLKGNNHFPLNVALTTDSDINTELVDVDALLVDRGLVVLSWLNKSRAEYRFL